MSDWCSSLFRCAGIDDLGLRVISRDAAINEIREMMSMTIFLGETTS
jgi:hypothetical protein